MTLSQSSQFIIFKCNNLDTIKDFEEFRAAHPDIAEMVSVPTSQIEANIGDCPRSGASSKSAGAARSHRKSRWVYGA